MPDFKGKYIKHTYQNLCAPCLPKQWYTAPIFKAEVIGHLLAYLHCLTWCYNCFFCGFQAAFVKEARDTLHFPSEWRLRCSKETFSISFCWNYSSNDFLLLGFLLVFKEFLMNFYYVGMKCYSICYLVCPISLEKSTGFFFLGNWEWKNARVKRLCNTQCSTKLCKAKILNNNLFLIACSPESIWSRDGWNPRFVLLYFLLFSFKHSFS